MNNQNCGMTCVKCGKFEEGNGLQGHVCAKTIYYGPPDEERYHHDCLDDYMQDFLGGFLYEDEELPETIEVVGMSPIAITENWIKGESELVVERILENFDEDYGDFEGGTTVDKKKLQVINEAAIDFVKMIAEAYPVWKCEEVSRETVKVSDYVEAEDQEGQG